MGKYKKCPRCELNYILQTEDYCSVCKEEMMGIVSNDMDYDDSFLRICPRCGVNTINDDQEYCEACRADIEALSVDPEVEEEEWQKNAKDTEVAFPDIDDEDDDADLDPALVLEDPDILAELESEEEADAELDKEDEEYEDDEPDDFDDFDDLDDYDEDEDDDEGDDDDDDDI